MLIDWFTTVAQIINFLILIVLLKRFLYGPITNAMQKREERIAAHMREAEETVKQAEQEADLYRQKQQELDEQREALLNRIKQQVEQERQALLKKAREEVESSRVKWYESLEHEQQTLVQALRQRAGHQIAMTVRRVLSDLANVDLEQHIAEIFLERLHHLPEVDRQAIRLSLTANANSGQPLLIHSTFTLLPEMRSQLMSAIHSQIAEGIPVEFATIPDPICGIELKTPGYKISWNLGHYLENLEAELYRALENGSHSSQLVNGEHALVTTLQN